MRQRSALPPNLPVSTTRLRRVLAATLGFAVVVVAAVCTVACNGQGEGQLCDPKAGNSGNNDCQSGLTCESRPAYVIAPYGVCCPSNGQSTTTACSVNGSSVDASPAPPAEVEASADAAPDSADAAPESAADGADGPTESATDAAVGADGSDATTE